MMDRRGFMRTSGCAVVGSCFFRHCEAITVPNIRYDNTRTAANTSETYLTASNVAAGKFGRLYTFAADGPVWAAPLYLENITVSGVLRNCIIVCSMANTVYCLDADNPGTTLWSRSLGTVSTIKGINNLTYGAFCGCLSTPVADIANNVLIVCAGVATTDYKLFRINLSTGVISTTSAVIAGSVTGTGDPGVIGGAGESLSGVPDTVSGGVLSFFPRFQLQRAGLTLDNGRVYVAFGSIGDEHPWHGWVFAYNATTLAQVAVFCTSPNGYGASIWGAGIGLSADGLGNLFTVTGNGTTDLSTNWAESILKFDRDLNLTGTYTPANYADLNTLDEDLGGVAAMLVPGTNLILTGGKDFQVYTVDRTTMAQGQVFPTNPSPPGSGTLRGIFGGCFINSTAYFPNNAGRIYRFTLSGSTFNTTPVLSASDDAYPGAAISVSSNGASNTVVWGITLASAGAFGTAKAATLRAYDPTTLVELWNGAISGNGSKFATPMVANGKVYVSHQAGLDVFGLLPSSSMRGAASRRGAAAQR